MKIILRSHSSLILKFLLAILASILLSGLITVSSLSETFYPDLIISDIWTIEDNLCFQVKNIGLGDAMPEHVSQLWVNDFEFLSGSIETVLSPGERFNICQQKWSCPGDYALLFAQADIKLNVSESDENNNSYQEEWVCDKTAPVILEGPFVEKTGDTSVKVTWKTDEPGDSDLIYDFLANTYRFAVVNIDQTTDHMLELFNLTPATSYQYQVSTRDSSGNVGKSKVLYFYVDPLIDTKPPINGSPNLTRIQSPFVRFHATLPASDDQEVEHVELFLDDTLIGSDYSSDGSGNFGVELVPGSIGLSHLDFFADHIITTIAQDRYGLITKNSYAWSPTPEPMDGELEIVSPGEDTIFYFSEDTTPAGTEISFSVYAAQFSGELCPPPGVGGDLECRHISEPVETIRWTINGETWENHPYATFREYNWNADHVPMGDYPLIVQAIATDGSYLTEHRTIHLRRGTPDLVVSRSVFPEGHAFRVNLNLQNQGTVPVEISTVDDSVLGFQVLDPEDPDYLFQAAYDPLSRLTDIHIDLRTPSSWLILWPDQSKVISYLVVPILSPEYPFEEFSIGSINVQVRMSFSGSIESRSYASLLNQTTDGIRLSSAVETMRSESDYLIVTNPQMIGYFDYGSGLADQLLDRLGELSIAKGGMLGYLEGAPTMHEIEETIETWGQEMQGSGGTPAGYIQDGYLLLVGETNIIPAGAIRFSDHWWWDDLTVGLTDAFYADTLSNLIDPELMVGRIVGNGLADLIIPIETILNMEKGTPGYGYDGTDALLLEGFPRTRNNDATESDFASVTAIIEDKFTVKSIPFVTISTPDYLTRDAAITDFLNYFPGRDILHLAGHGSSSSLDDLWTGDLSGLRNAFGGTNPFVFGVSCLTGRYTESVSLAERFIQAGAAAYFGSTEVSYNNSNRAGSAAIMDRVIPGRSFGSIIKEVKKGFGSDYIWGFIEDYWTAEYNLYGDPEIGENHILFDSSYSSDIESILSSSTNLSYQIPMFDVSYLPNQRDWVEIPGGYWLQDIGQPLVPYVVFEEQIAEGYQVQDVRLVSRSNMTLIGDLDLPIFEDMIDRPSPNETKAPGNPDFWPGYDYNWHILQNSDGSSSLQIQVYPFWYYKEAGEGVFYQDYSFDIITSSTQTRILNLTIDNSTYNFGDEINISTIISNQGIEPQDILLATNIRIMGHEYSVDGLPILLLNDVQGIADIDQTYLTNSLAKGDYLLDVMIYDKNGIMLDSASVPFKMGLYVAKTSNFTISESSIQPGDLISFGLDLVNVGSEVIDGEVILQVFGSERSPVFELTNEITNLVSQENKHVELNWLTPLDLKGNYKVITYFIYGPQTTEPMEIYIQTEKKIYLPIISK